MHCVKEFKVDHYIERKGKFKLKLCSTQGPVMNNILHVGYKLGKFLYKILHFFLVVESIEGIGQF